jgi:hypothetical protein
LFADKRIWESKIHREIFELTALASVVVATFWISRVGGHVVKKVADESKHMIIEALLRGSAAGRTPFDLHVTGMMGQQSRVDIDYVTADVCRLRTPRHRIALGIDPIVIVIVGRHTTYAVVGVQAMKAVLAPRHSRLTALNPFLVSIPVATAGGALVPVTMDVSYQRGKDKESL